MFPAALKAGAARFLEGVSRKDLAQRSSALSSHYRRGGASGTTVAGEADVVAYVASRMPATFAACTAAFAAAASRDPAFAPKSLLDVGTGPGTASWAAVQTWPGLQSVTMLDSNAPFLDVAQRLASGSDHAALSRAACKLEDITRRGDPLPKCDVVVAGYALAELEASCLSGVISALWDACCGVLILIEPGTPAGYARIAASRAQLIESGALVVAPCPHARSCPIQPPDWCHFAQRLPRSRDHMKAKSADVPFEDEKFSYVAVGRDMGPLVPVDARILAPPRDSKPGLTFKLCTANGIVERTVSRRDRADFTRMRRLKWGDAFADADQGG